ncbi:unnamed protein product [Oppiella nova]|uniref:DUF4590 domain-containing protein n=1 Tax=Oppiella nova TaxID=334625 RepID=A0A7R9LCI5_9ACAR|nr:unnamed protein product [Oppiella nova]CAG2161380.1 unnamed protein product [Oppiella nova]
MMWTVAALNKKYFDALGTYNSLNDPHLHQYFRKPKVRSHLIQVGLMTSEGKIIPEAVVRLRRLEDERRKQLHQLLTEVLEKGETNRLGLKRLHETRTLESEAKWELVQRAKIAFESQSNTTGLTTRTQSNDSKKSSSSTTTSMSWFRRVVQIKPKLFINNRRRVRVTALNRYERPKSSYGIRSSNKVKPDLQSEKELNEQFSDILSLDGLSLQDTDDEEYGGKRSGLWSSKKIKPSIITLRFNGLTNNCLTPRRIQISQQLYSGGNAITIFDRMVTPGENLTFGVRPHRDNPFSMTVLIDGIRDLRVSTCCEHKHKKGFKISHFTLIDVSGGKMCANCRKSANQMTKSLSTGAVSAYLPKEKSQNNGLQNEGPVVDNNDNHLSDSDVDDAEQTVIELEKRSSGTSSPVIADNNEEQYESEFETETPESVRMRSTSVSSDDSNAGHQEVIEVEVHNNP